MVAGLFMILVGAYVLRGVAMAQVVPVNSQAYYPKLDVPATAGIYGCTSGGIGAALVLTASFALCRILHRPGPGPRGFPVNP